MLLLNYFFVPLDRRNSFVENEPKDETGTLLEASNAILERCVSRNGERKKKKKGMLQGIKAGIGMAVEARRLSAYWEADDKSASNSRYIKGILLKWDFFNRRKIIGLFDM